MGDDDKPMDETPEEATAQRTDDYDALARRIDDVLDRLGNISERLDKVDALTDTMARFLDNAKVETTDDGKDNDNDGTVDEPDEKEEVSEVDLTTPLEELDFDID